MLLDLDEPARVLTLSLFHSNCKHGIVSPEEENEGNYYLVYMDLKRR